MTNWFDDPEWEQRQKSKRPRQEPSHIDGISYRPSRSKPPKSAQHHTTSAEQPVDYPKDLEINIKISLPLRYLKKKFEHLRNWFESIPARNLQIAGVVFALMLIFGVGGTVLYNHKNNKNTAAQSQAQPDFNPLYANGNKPDTEKASFAYNSDRHVASYNDTIAGVDITVSQQPLPDNFKKDKDGEAEKLSKTFKNVQPFYAGEVKAYKALSDFGQQTVFFVKDDLLIFINAPKQLDQDGLLLYITSLK
jgi:hypothetical protein